ncbi:MAG: hypothetical protein DRP27_05345 [Thermotogae bacterium]|nr:MAG: hypothetical protein DRP27_05345 [Thermotogota bacterium]
MVKLNLGCGGDIREGYVNIDVRKIERVDLVLDLESERLPYGDGTVDEILAKDVLEHFSYRKVEEILKDWHRVLKPRGVLTIQTPDFDQIVKYYTEGKIKSWWELSYWLYGGQEYKENTHKCIFTKPELCDLLKSIGFEVVECHNDNSNMIVKVVKR